MEENDFERVTIVEPQKTLNQIVFCRNEKTPLAFSLH